MKIVMTLLVRDEADIVGEHLRYHFEQGIDFVIATDHRSVDGTTDVLRDQERDGRLCLIHEPGDQLEQAAWVTEMARRAATEFGADWVVNADADEFYWPREASLGEVLAAVPRRYGVVRGYGRHFVARPEDGRPFFERMTVRRRPTDDPGSPYRPGFKAIHRAAPDVDVTRGNHNAYGSGLAPLREWMPIEVFHFPIRTRAQMERKFIRRESNVRDVAVDYERETARAIRRSSAESVFTELVVDDEALARGLRDGWLEEDARLRHVLRGGAPEVARTLDDDVSFALDFEGFEPADSPPRLERRLRALRDRVFALDGQ
jgi:hypothetical protein